MREIGGGGRKSNPKTLMLRKNIRKTISILQNISLYKNPKELLYYLADNNKMGHENNKMILKLDLKYFWIEFSTPITAGLSDFRGAFAQGTTVCN